MRRADGHVPVGNVVAGVLFASDGRRVAARVIDDVLIGVVLVANRISIRILVIRVGQDVRPLSKGQRAGDRRYLPVEHFDGTGIAGALWRYEVCIDDCAIQAVHRINLSAVAPLSEPLPSSYRNCGHDCEKTNKNYAPKSHLKP